MLTNLTIIIPTFNRQNLLLRQLKYLKNWKTNVVIVDASEISLLKKYPGHDLGNFKYIHSLTSMSNRISLALPYINTDFTVCLAEDDFYLPSGLISAMELLIENKDSVGCMGQSCGLDVFKGEHYVFKYGASLLNYSNCFDSPIDRVRFGLRKYRSATFYAVYKSKSFINIWKEKRENFSSLEGVEYEQAIRAYLEGKFITTELIYYVRSFEESSIASKIDGDVLSIRFSDWKNLVSNEVEYLEFKNRIIKLFVYYGSTYSESMNLFKYIIEGIDKKSHVGLINSNYVERAVKQIISILLLKMDINVKKFKKLKYIKFIQQYLEYHSRQKITAELIIDNYTNIDINNLLIYLKEK
jgi:glycosyltransferase domain-containing protein